jgi:hypothetical protein
MDLWTFVIKRMGEEADTNSADRYKLRNQRFLSWKKSLLRTSDAAVP